MATAGSIVIDLVMKTGMFETDTKRAEKRLRDMEKSAKQFGVAVGVAIAGAATALAVMVKSSINSMDSMNKLAQSVGVATEELSALTYVADLSGVSQDALGTSLVRLSKNMSEAARGSGEAKKGFDALGVSVKNADGTLKSSTAVLSEVAAKFATYRDSAEKTALAVNLFGKSGAGLIPLLNQGADGIAALEAEARALGITFDDEAGRAAEQFNDNLTRLNAVKKGLVNRITQELLPSLVRMTDRLFSTAKGADTLDKAARVAATGVKLIASVVAGVVGIFNTLGTQLGGTAAALVQFFSGDFAAAFETARQVNADFVGNVKATISSISDIWDDSAAEVNAEADQAAEKLAAPAILAEDKVKKAGKKIKDEAQRIYENIEKQLGRLQRDVSVFNFSDEQTILFDLRLEGANDEQLGRADKLLQTLRALREEEKARKKEIEGEERARGVLDDLSLEIDGLGKSNEYIATRNALLHAGVTAESEFGKQIIATTHELYAQGEAIDRQVELMDAFRGGISNAFADFVTGAKSAKDAAKDFLNDFAERITQMIANRWVEQLFGQMGTTGTGSGGGWLGTIASMFGGGRAGGGDAITGRAYLVGENGPEMFVPRTAGAVIPNERMAMAYGGGGRSFTQNLNVVVSGRPDRSTPEQIARATGREAARAMSRTGR